MKSIEVPAWFFWPMAIVLLLDTATDSLRAYEKLTRFHVDDAVEAGHAEYYLDENNERQWRWLPKGDQP